MISLGLKEFDKYLNAFEAIPQISSAFTIAAIWYQTIQNLFELRNILSPCKASQISTHVFSCSTKEPRSSNVFMHFDTKVSIDLQQNKCHYCALSKILQNFSKCHESRRLFTEANNNNDDKLNFMEAKQSVVKSNTVLV